MVGSLDHAVSHTSGEEGWIGEFRHQHQQRLSFMSLKCSFLKWTKRELAVNIVLSTKFINALDEIKIIYTVEIGFWCFPTSNAHDVLVFTKRSDRRNNKRNNNLTKNDFTSLVLSVAYHFLLSINWWFIHQYDMMLPH